MSVSKGLLASLTLLLAASIAEIPGVANAHAIIGTEGDGNSLFVLPDPGAGLPDPCQIQVTGLPAGDHGVHSLDYAGPDHALVSLFNDTRIFVVQISTASVVDVIDTGGGYTGTGTIAVSPNGEYALASGESDKVVVIEAPFDSGSTVRTVPLPASSKVPSWQTQAIVFDPAGRAFIIHTQWATGGGISVLDPPYDAVAFTIPMSNNQGGAIAISPDGETLLATQLYSLAVYIFHTPFSASSSPDVLALSSVPDGIVVTPDGLTALTVVNAAPNGLLAISAPFDASSQIEEILLPSAVSPFGYRTFEDIGISADGQLAILTGGSESRMPAAFVKAPFTAAEATAYAVDIGSVPDNGRGSGAVRFRRTEPQPMLSVYKCAPGTVTVGGDLNYRIHYANTASTVASDVTLRDTVPDGSVFVSASHGGGLAGDQVTYSLGDVAPGATGEVTLTVNVIAQSGTIDNADYSIESTDAPARPGPFISTRVVPVSVVKHAPAAVRPSSEFLYTLTYGNHTDSDLTNVVIQDRMPSDVTFVSADDGGTYADRVVTWNLETLPAGTTGQSVTFTVRSTYYESAAVNNEYWIEADGFPRELGPPAYTEIRELVADFDIDGNGTADALTDGLLAIRHLFGFTGTTLTNGAVDGGCTRCDGAGIADHIESIRADLDIDGNATTDALTDGLLVIRYLFGFNGESLIGGVIDPSCTRCDAAAVEAYCATLMP